MVSGIFNGGHSARPPPRGRRPLFLWLICFIVFCNFCKFCYFSDVRRYKICYSFLGLRFPDPTGAPPLDPAGDFCPPDPLTLPLSYILDTPLGMVTIYLLTCRDQTTDQIFALFHLEDIYLRLLRSYRNEAAKISIVCHSYCKNSPEEARIGNFKPNSHNIETCLSSKPHCRFRPNFVQR